MINPRPAVVRSRVPGRRAAAGAVVLAAALAGCTHPQAGRVDASPGAGSVHRPLRLEFARAASGGVRFTNQSGVRLAAGSCHAVEVDRARGYVLPDPACTPGAVDPTMTRDVLCAKGFTTTTRRPYSSTTNNWEERIGAAYGYAPDRTYEGDHLVPLTLGGVNDVANFWAEPNSQPPASDANPSGNPKDRIEVRLKAEVCAGHVTLDQAQAAIASDWVALATRPASQTLADAVRRVAG